ncbi:MAG: V-type ATP synthase subunit E [Candidatus Micrarchaeia archaeon]
MGLENLVHEIDHASKNRASAIIDDAQKEAEHIVSSASDAAKKSIESAKKQATDFSKSESAERLATAQTEAQKAISDAKDEAVNQCVARVWEHYSAARKRAGYAKNMRRWADLALEELSLPGAVLRCAAVDKQILSSAGFKVSITPLECSGGVIAESKDGKVMVDCTLESLFEQKKESLAKTIYSKLFSNMADYSIDQMVDSINEGAAHVRKKKAGKKKMR